MKKLIIVVIMLSMFLSACTGGNNINGTDVPVYGLLNKETKYNDKIVYDVSARNVIVGIIFSGSIFVPVYVVGWALFEPVKVKGVK